MNIYDIAKLANVSIATVSRVVNNSPKVSPKTKEKVLAVMKENEYTPNAFARGLGLGSMKTVGIICPHIDDIYMAKAVSYLEQNLHAHGYDCILGCSGFKQEEKEDYVRLLLSKKIDTLILVGSTYAGNGKDESDTDYITLAKEMIAVGVQYFIVTDIAKDGTLSGVNLKQLKDLRDATNSNCNIIASGGVHTIEDIRGCKELGLYGTICGKSIYKGTLDLKEAIALAEGV